MKKSELESKITECEELIFSTQMIDGWTGEDIRFFQEENAKLRHYRKMLADGDYETE